MRSPAQIEAEIQEVKDRQAKLLDDRGDSHREWLRFDQQRGDAILDGDESTLQEVNRKLQDVSKQRDNLQAGITVANQRLERLEQELLEARRTEATNVDQAARLQGIEKLIEYRLIAVRAREEQEKLAPEVERLEKVARLAHSKVTRATPFRELTGTVEELEAEAAHLRTEVGKLDKNGRKVMEQLTSEIVQGEASRAATKRRLEIEKQLQVVEQDIVAGQRLRAELPISADPADGREHRLAKIDESIENRKEKKACLEAELESLKAS